MLESGVGGQNLSMPKMLAAMRYGERIIKMGEAGNHVVVCWGPTGAGKSSSVLTLSGEHMLGYHNKGNPILMNKDSINFDVKQHQAKVEAYQEETQIFIQEKAYSGTKYPIVIPMKTQPDQPTVKLWDTAGFADNTGHTQTLINAYFLNRIFNLQQKVKLVFCINFASLAADLKGQYLKKDVLRLTEILQDFPNYNQSMALLVTKVPPSADRHDIKELLKENVDVILNQDKRNPQLRRFFEYIHHDKMPFMILRRPQLVGKVSQDNPTTVTNQYEQFKREFYFLVVNELKEAEFPKITVPAGLSPTQRGDCQDLALQTAENIRKEIRQFVEKLTPFAQVPYNFGSISPEDRTNRHHFNKIGAMKTFIQKLDDITRNTEMNSSDECSRKLEEIRLLLENPEYAFCCSMQGEILTCNPLKNLNNSFIIIQFLESVKLGDRCDGVRYERMVELMLEAFQDEIRNTEQQMRHWDRQVQTKMKNYISGQISNHLAQYKKDKLYTIWRKKVRDFPCFFLSVSKFNPHMNRIQEYCNYLVGKEQEFCMDDHHDIDMILSTLQIAQSYLDTNINADAFVANQLTPVISQRGRELIKAQTQFNTWQEDELLAAKRMDGTMIKDHVDIDAINRKKPIEQLRRETAQDKERVDRCLNDIKKNESKREELEKQNNEVVNAKDKKMRELRAQLEEIRRESDKIARDNENMRREIQNGAEPGKKKKPKKRRPEDDPIPQEIDGYY